MLSPDSSGLKDRVVNRAPHCLCILHALDRIYIEWICQEYW